MKINCPHCEAKLEAGKELYGEIVECPNCKGEVAIPFESTPTASAPEKAKKKNISSPKPEKKKPAENEYKMPILASIFKFLAITGIILLVIWTVILILLRSKTENIPMDTPLIYVSGFICILINMGISQLIEYFAKTAYYAEKISRQIDKISTLSKDQSKP